MEKSIEHCTYSSQLRNFGIIDKKPALIDESNGEHWQVVIKNFRLIDVHFTAIDKCLVNKRLDGKDNKACEGVLYYENTIIFIEIKESDGKNTDWVNTAIEQLKISIEFFKKFTNYEIYEYKEAIIANQLRPSYGSNKTNKLNTFSKETGFVLSFRHRIEIP